jgi:hypothetical protein
MSSEFPSLWGLLIEKAWSKVQINYENSIGGGGYQTLSALLGCPVNLYAMWYISKFFDGPALYSTLKDLQEDSLFSLSSTGFGSDDTKLNECGATVGHSFPILKLLELEDEGTVHRMYLLRDPRGLNARTRYN